MGSGLVRSARACALGVAVASFVAATAGAATPSGDATIARAGAFVASDFPAGFTSSPPPSTTHAEQIVMAKGVDGCGPYVTMQRRMMSTLTADSLQFADSSTTFGNEVAVFSTDKSAASLLALVEKPSMVGCLENYLEKQFRQSAQGRLDEVTVSLERQDIAGLGDDSVLYEGTMEVVATDGSKSVRGIGSATVRVGRAIDAITFISTGSSATDVLIPAVDASVARLRTALSRNP